jgi:glycosyltransferase involved in cell wall biosynthesis
MTIGYAIPSCKSYLTQTYRLLESLSKSTVLPNEVSISISDVDEGFTLENDYGLNIKLQTTPNTQNACINRNIASSNLNTDIICVFDCDDMVHPKRNEFLINCFKEGANCIVHNYTQSTEQGVEEFLSGEYESPDYERDFLHSFSQGIGPVNPNQKVRYHNAHVSIKKEVFEKVKYIDKVFCDSWYNRHLVENGYKLWYLKNKLSYYILR